MIADEQAWFGDARVLLERIDERAGRFNVFRVLHLERDEVRGHSRFLAALLDPAGTHGQRDRFLKSFLALEPIRAFIREVGAGSWSVTTEEPRHPAGRLDILLECSSPPIIIAIENKVDAGEGADQCERYFRWLERHPDRVTTLLVYLTRGGGEAQSMKNRAASYARLNYSQVADWIESEVKAKVPCDLAAVLKSYAEICRELSGSLAGGRAVPQENELEEFLCRDGNLEVAFRLAAETEAVRLKLVRKFLEEVDRSARETAGATGLAKPEIVPDERKPFVALRFESEDYLLVSAQLEGGRLRYGLAWRDAWVHAEPPAVTALRERASKVLDSGEGAGQWWLAPVLLQKSIEQICIDTAEGHGLAHEIGTILGTLIRDLRPELREVNASLRAQFG